MGEPNGMLGFWLGCGFLLGGEVRFCGVVGEVWVGEAEGKGGWVGGRGAWRCGDDAKFLYQF